MRNLVFNTLLLLSLFFSTNAFSQTKYDEVVHLKNGTIIKGTIIEFIPEKSIIIRSKDGNEFFFRMDEIEKITREPYNIEKITIRNKQIKQSGFTNTTDLILGFDAGYEEDIVYGFQTINGYLFNPHFSMGAGVGVESYKNQPYIPLFIDMHAYFTNSIVSPYFSINVGRTFGVEENKGGVLFNPTLGVRAYFNAKTAVDFSIGYKMQEYEYDYEWNSNQYTYSNSTEFITFKTGVTF